MNAPDSHLLPQVARRLVPEQALIDLQHRFGTQCSTAQAVRDLLERGFRPPNIAVLSCRGLASSRIAGPHGPTHLAGLAVKRQAGYDADGNALWTDGELLVDSVYRFKGQAADAVVITDIDFNQIDARSRRLLFVALTRARLHAILVTSDRAARVLRDRLA